MIKRLIIPVLIIFLALFYFDFKPVQSFSTAIQQDKTEKILLEIFENSGAEFYELKIEGWKKIKGKQASEEEMEEIVKLALNEFGATQVEKKWQKDNNFQSLSVTAQIGEQSQREKTALITILLQNVENNFYLLINIDESRFEKINFWQSALKKIFNYYNTEPEIFFNITGVFPGKLSQREQEQLIKGLFQTAEAKIIEGIATEELVSYSGYSPLITNSLTSEGKKINLNIACRVNTEDEKTHLFLGIPVLTIEY